MKKKTIISCFAIVATFLLFTFPMELYALNYTISFTGTGASTSVESVVVQNLTKGTTVTVPTGNVLNLTDITTSVDNINTSAEQISVFPNPMQEKSTISFFAKSEGITQINVFSLDGKKIIGVNRNLSQGNSSFQLSMPKGAYTIQVQGNGFSYSAKVISQINSNCKAQIAFSGNENQNTNKPEKSKSAVTTMLYTSGDKLLYKGTSGNYSTIVTDIPSSTKTTNFEFVECKDGDGNNYSVVKIGTQTWMAENLKTTKYNDFTSIPYITDAVQWSNLTTSACSAYNNDLSSIASNGVLYNWYSTQISNLAPTGWRIPSLSDWYGLLNYLGSNKNAEAQLTIGGSTGFSASFAGMRSNTGSYFPLYITFLSNESANSLYCWGVSFLHGDLGVTPSQLNKKSGFTIRCIK